MNQQKLKKYQKLYYKNPMSKSVFIKYFSLGSDFVVPLSLSHGIDMGHLELPQDILLAEPIHWCYNENIYQRSKLIKPSVRLPHPWLMLHSMLGKPEAKKNGKVLLVGVPPSKTNDINLWEIIRKKEKPVDAILIKHRNETKSKESFDFWTSKKINTLSAGEPDPEHYDRLMKILLEYEYILSPIFSSVAILAAAIGCKVSLMKNYSYCAFGIKERDMELSVKSIEQRKMVCIMTTQNAHEQARELSLNILGVDELNHKESSREEILKLIKELNEYVYIPHAKNNISKMLYSQIALLSGKKSFLRSGLIRMFKRRIFGLNNQVHWIKCNPIDAVINGLSTENYKTRELRSYEYGAVPGHGADEFLY